MKINRRHFFKISGALAAASLLKNSQAAVAAQAPSDAGDTYGCLVDTTLCVGCRYCMVACPFQVPAYEYYNPLTPQVRKCTFCFDYIKDGGLPACAQVCPREVITFGKKDDLLRLARWKMKNNPGQYVDHIYGEHEVGGTSWLYLSSEPFETVGFPKLGTKAPPRLTEAIQHGLFQYFAAPIILYGVLGGIMGITGYLKGTKEVSKSDTGEKGDTP